MRAIPTFNATLGLAVFGVISCTILLVLLNKRDTQTKTYSCNDALHQLKELQNQLNIQLRNVKSSLEAHHSNNHEQNKNEVLIARADGDKHVFSRILGTSEDNFTPEQVIKVADRVALDQIREGGLYYTKYEKGTGANSPPVVYQNVFNPSISCMFKPRVGETYTDGGKYLCDPHKLKKLPHKCRLYSFGSRLDLSYEQAMVDHYNCEAFTFDPTVERSAIPKDGKIYKDIHFYFKGLGPINKEKNNFFLKYYNQNLTMNTLMQITQELGHEYIDILKIDIEWSEIGALPYLLNEELQHFQSLKVKIIQLEDHLCCERDTFRDYWLPVNTILHREGYYMFSAEVNQNRVSCVEYAWVHKSYFLDQF
jgi:hypothetical protein